MSSFLPPPPPPSPLSQPPPSSLPSSSPSPLFPYYYPTNEQVAGFTRQLQKDLTHKDTLKQLIQKLYPTRTQVQKEQKSFLLGHLDEMDIPMYKYQLQQLKQQLLKKSKEYGREMDEGLEKQIFQRGQKLNLLWKLRQTYQNAIVRLPVYPDQNRNMVSFLNSVPYPIRRLRDTTTNKIMEDFLANPTIDTAKKVEKRFRDKQQQQQKVQQKRLQEKLGETFRKALFQIPLSSTEEDRNTITFLYSVPYPIRRLRDITTNKIVEDFLKNNTIENAKKVEQRFRYIEDQYLKKEQQQKRLELLGAGYF